jgi:hypothetical protein
MAQQFFRNSRTWVVDFRYQGRARRWFRTAPDDVADMTSQMRALLAELYGDRAQLETVRPASEEEERQYLRGEEPKNVLCPTGRSPRSAPGG